MANISDATGVIEIKHLSGCTKEQFWKAFEDCTTGVEYGISWMEVENDNKSATFDGTGRWVFCNTLEEMLKHLDEWHCEPHEDAPRILQQSDWELRFNYYDAEPGCGVLYEREEAYSHKAGEPFENIEHVVLDDTDYEYDILNYVKVTGQDIDYAVEDFFGWMDEDDLKETIDEVKTRLSSTSDDEDKAILEDVIEEMENYLDE